MDWPDHEGEQNKRSAYVDCNATEMEDQAMDTQNMCTVI